MKKNGLKFAILVNDWGSSNYPTEYEVKAVFDDIKDTKEVLLSVLTDYFDEWCFDDYDAEEYLNDVFKAFENHESFIDHEGEIGFKFEEIPYYTKE
jgi:hypothetical protein